MDLLQTATFRREVSAQKAFTRFFTPAKRSPTKEEQTILAMSERFIITSSVGDLVSFSWGSGSTVLLVHGWGSCAGQLTPFVALLVEAGFRVVACDLPAHGETSGIQTNGFEFAEAIHAIASHFSGFAGIIAHSWGAAGSLFALSEGVVAQRVVCLGSACWLSSSVEMMARLLRLSLETEAELRRLIELKFGEEIWQRGSANLRVKGVKSPGLLFHDRHDRKVPHQESEAIAEAWQGAELVLTTGLGHERILQDPQVIARSIKFIQGEIA